MHLLSKFHVSKPPGLLLLLFFIALEADSQAISFSVEHESLEKVFLLIEKQSGYNFIYTSEAMSRAKPVTIQVRNETLSNVLRQCFKDQPLSYTTENRYVIVKLKPADRPVSSQRLLRGKVLNENGMPLAGVSIYIKNSSLATGSDENGEFIFQNAPDSLTMLITGAEIESQEIVISNQPFVLINVRTKIGVLDESVVIAYGKTSRRYSTGTVSSVKASEISKQPVSNPLTALAGRISGLQVSQISGVPGATHTVRLRGQNSIANGNDPLFIIDGVPFPSSTLNGPFGGPASVSSSSFSNLNPSDIESIEVLKDADATAIYGSRGANGVILITTKKGVQGKTKFSANMYSGAGKITRKIDLLKTPEYISMRKEAFANDGVNPTNANAPDLLLWYTSRYTDWQDVLIGNTMHISDVNASLSGGNTQTQFLIGTGYHKETTVFPGEFAEEKISGSMSIVHRSIDGKFNLSLSNSYLQNKKILPVDDLTQQVVLSPNTPAIYREDGNLNWENSTWTNPLSMIEQHFITNTDNFFSNLSMGYKLVKGLELKFSGGFRFISSRDHIMTPARSYDPALNLMAAARFGTNRIKTLIAEPQIHYTSKFGAGNLSVLTGITLQSTEQNALYQSGTGYTSDDLLSSVRAAAVITTTAETDIKYRYAGLFGRINYDLKKKYLFSLTVRRDGSSRFGEANRFANFGSVAAGWIFSNESFLRKASFLSFGKIKASAGITGNDQIGDYKYLDLYVPGNVYQGVTTFSPLQLYNPEYGWEKVRKLELGIDLGVLNNAVLLSANFYYNTTSNQLVSYPLPATTGFSGILRNIPATINNTGIELELNTVNIKTGNWNWTTSANLTIPRNKLVAYEGLEKSTYSNTYVIGKSLFIVKKYTHLGVEPSTGNHIFKDYDSDGKISTPNDQQEIIFTGQQFFGGVLNTISYRKLSLSLLLQFAQQLYSTNYLSRFSRPGLLMNQPENVLERWRKPGDITEVQRFTISNSVSNTAFSNYKQSDKAYSDASFIRLRSLYISYDLLNSKIRRMGFSDCKVFVQGHNLFVITGYKGFDPETKSSLPPVRMLTAGLQFTL
jgi:TonB-linked SusC/RagA family outer membrane protein